MTATCWPSAARTCAARPGRSPWECEGWVGVRVGFGFGSITYLKPVPLSFTQAHLFPMSASAFRVHFESLVREPRCVDRTLGTSVTSSHSVPVAAWTCSDCDWPARQESVVWPAICCLYRYMMSEMRRIRRTPEHMRRSCFVVRCCGVPCTSAMMSGCGPAARCPARDTEYTPA